MRQNDGGPAFPTEESHGDDYEGMSLRDYFAAAAMQAQITCTETVDKTEQGIAKYAYLYADAMLAERNK